MNLASNQIKKSLKKTFYNTFKTNPFYNNQKLS